MAVTRERVAEQLLALRKLHGTPDKPLPQEKAAQRAGVSWRNWQRWEKKKVLAGADSLGKVADGFGVPLDIFDDGKVDRSSTPLADRLDEINEKLDKILERLPPKEVEGDEQIEEAASGPDGQEPPQDDQDDAEEETG